MAEVPLPTPTDNPAPSTDIRDAVYAGSMLDKVVTSTEPTYTDRLGGEHYTVDGIKAEGDKVVEETRQNLIPLSRQYMTLSAAQADIVNIPDGSTTYVRSADGSSLADEYINNGGTLEATGRQMPSQQSVGEVADFSKQAASSLNEGEYVTFGDVTNGTVTAEYITVDGTKASSATRKLMSVVMASGDTAFYKAKHASKMTASEADIPNALFVADAGNITVIAPAPLALNVTSYTDGHFTATEAGTFYLNTVLYEDETRGTLISGVIGENIFYNPRVLGVEGIGVTVASNDIATRDMQAVVANGSPEDVTASAEMVNNQVLFSNGAIQVIPEDSSTYGDWAIAFFPVRAGDVVEYYGWFNTFTTSTATYISQLDTRKNYIAQLLGDTGLTGYNTVSVAATHDGYIAIRVRLRDSGVTKTHTIKRKSPLPAKALMSNFFASSSSDEVMINIYGTDSSARIPGYVDNAGAIISSVTRWYMTTHLDAGDVAFFKGRGRQSETDTNGISAAVFVPDSGGAVVVLGNPLSLAAYQDFDSKYTAPSAGTLYVNVATNSGSLISGAPGSEIFWQKSVVKTESRGTEYVPVPANNRDLESIKANGAAVDVTASAEVLMNYVLYRNGVYQSISGDAWCMKFVPVRKGDKVRYYGVFNTSSGSVLTYISQLDWNKKYLSEVLANAPAAGYQTVEVTAPEDGYIAIRVRLKNTDGSALAHSINRIGPKYSDGGDTPVVTGEGAICTPSMDLLPVKLDTTWLYNSPSYQQNGIVTFGDYQYVVCIAQGRLPNILQRSIYGGPWSRFDLSTIAGNPFASPNAQDGHNSFSIAVTKDGYIVVSGNQHVNNCRCVISNNPHDISAWTAITFTDSTVTYPRFVKYPDGTLQVFWREGGSGAGAYYINTFNDTTRQFGTKKLLISSPDGGNPYEQTICVDKSGVLHVGYGIRIDASSADSNSGLYYAKSADKGNTFTNAAGTTSYAVPLYPGNSEQPVVIGQGSGYVNQNGACVDLKGYYHTVYWQLDGNGYTQIIHLWWDGTAWHTEPASDFTYTENTSDSLLPGTSSRPLIVCTRYGKIYVIYRTTEDGLGGQVRAIDVTTPGAPVDYLMARFDVYKTELSVNIQEVLNTGVLSMMLYTGVNRVGANLEQKYLAECAWLFQAQLP